MNKTELIGAIAKEANLTKVDAKKALDAFTNNVTKSLKNGNSVSLIGFGTFSVAKRASRQGINPATKKKMTIPAKTVAKFKAGANLSNAVKKAK